MPFANFEAEYAYDQVLKLPSIKEQIDTPVHDGKVKPKQGEYEYTEEDVIVNIKEEQIGYTGMKIDRMFFQQFESKMKGDIEIAQLVEQDNIENATGIALDKYIDKPEEYFTLDKLRRALKIDRRITMRELLELIFFGNEIKDKTTLLEEEFVKFLSLVDVSEITDINAFRYSSMPILPTQRLKR